MSHNTLSQRPQSEGDPEVTARMQTVRLSAADVAALREAYYLDDPIPAGYDPAAEATAYTQQAAATADPATVAQEAGSAEFWEEDRPAPNLETDAERAARAAVLAAQSQQR